MRLKRNQPMEAGSGDGGGTAKPCCAIVQLLDEPIHVVDSHLRVVHFNDKFARWLAELGLPTMEVGRTVRELFPFIPERVLKEYRRVFRTGRRLVTRETTAVKGVDFVTDTEKIPILARGRAKWVITIVRDVTARVRAEEALRDSEARLRAVLSNLHETVVVMYDRDGTILDAWYSEKLARRYGLRPEDVRGKRMGELYPPKLAAQRVRRVRDVFRTGRPSCAEYVLPLPGGRFRLENTLSPMRDAAGRIIAVVGFARDVTAHRQAEDALKEGEAKYRFLAESINDIVYSTNGKGRIAYVSRQVERYGFRAEALLGRGMLEFVAPADRERIAADVRRHAATGEGFPSEFRMLDASGGVHWFEDRGEARYDEAGSFLGLTGVLREITERKEAQAALLAAREEERRRLARELHDSLGQAMIAMHLRLQNACAVAASGGDGLPAMLREMAGQCGEAIREVRQISHGLFPPTLEQLGLPSALRQLLTVCDLAGIGATFRCEPRTRAARLAEAVEIALFRIAQEAVHNAIRHAACRRIGIELRLVRGGVALAVTDDGKGFDCSGPPARGMGLRSMIERAEALGGSLHLASAPGRTRIEAHIPAARQRARTPAAPKG